MSKKVVDMATVRQLVDEFEEKAARHREKGQHGFAASFQQQANKYKTLLKEENILGEEVYSERNGFGVVVAVRDGMANIAYDNGAQNRIPLDELKINPRAVERYFRHNRQDYKDPPNTGNAIRLSWADERWRKYVDTKHPKVRGSSDSLFDKVGGIKGAFGTRYRVSEDITQEQIDRLRAKHERLQRLKEIVGKLGIPPKYPKDNRS